MLVWLVLHSFTFLHSNRQWTLLGATTIIQTYEEEKELERQLCQDKGAGEWFRLESGEKKCRDVIQCTVSVRKNCQFSTNQKYHFVAVISFPSVLVFQLNDDH